jgi:translation initiation factor eIF-2B subunit delta
MTLQMATNINGTSSEVPKPPAPNATTNGNEGSKAADVPDGAQPQVSKAELKARAKAEKAARRAQTKEAKGTAAPTSTDPATSTSAQSGALGADGKASKGGKGKPDQPQKKQQQQQASKEQQSTVESRPGQSRRPSGLGRQPSMTAREKDPRSEIPEIFSHIPMAKRISTTQAERNVHPAVLALGQRMGAFVLTDSISRLEGTLLALRKVSAYSCNISIPDTHAKQYRSSKSMRHQKGRP